MFSNKENLSSTPDILPLTILKAFPEKSFAEKLRTRHEMLAKKLKQENAAEILAWLKNLHFKEKTSNVESFSAAYFERFLRKMAETAVEEDWQEELAQNLTADIEDVVREVCLAEKTTQFKLSVDVPHQKMTGEGYKNDELIVLAQTFVQALAEKGLLIPRALTEQFVLELLKEKWLNIAHQTDPLHHPDAETVDLLVTSPPGLWIEGYHGSNSAKNWNAKETHQTFFYRYQITNRKYQPNSVTNQPELISFDVDATQYRTYHNIRQLLDVHKKLNQEIKIDKNYSITSQIFANVLEIRHQKGIAQEQLDHFFESILYEGQEKWGRQPEQAPQISHLAEFWQDYTAFFQSFYLPQAMELFSLLLPNPSTDKKYIELRLKQLDLLFLDFMDAIEKQVRERNINPLYDEYLEKRTRKFPFSGIFQKLTKKTQQKSDQDAPRLMENIETYRHLHHLREKSIVFGQQLSQEERDWYVGNVHRFLELSDFAFGSAQCLVVAQLKAPITIMRESFRSGSGESLTQFNASLSLLSKEQKKYLFSEIKKQNYVEVSFVVNGEKRTYMVPDSYLKGKGCYIEGDQIMGPCDLSLDDPREQLAFRMTKGEFERYLQTLEDAIEIDDVAGFLDENTAASEKPRMATLLDNLRKLVLPTTISINDLIAGQTPLKFEARTKLPGKIFQRISQSKNPLREMEKIVHELITNLSQEKPPTSIETTPDVETHDISFSDASLPLSVL